MNESLHVLTSDSEVLAELHGGRTRTGTAVRTTDVTGVSGTGPVAHVTECADGHLIAVWRDTDRIAGGTEIVLSVDTWIAIHGHDGTTTIRWD